MPVANSVAMVLLQVESHRDVHWASIFVGLIALALWAQALGVVAIGIYAYRFLQRLDRLGNSFEQKTGPILEKTNLLLEDLTPKVRAISENVEQLSYTMREKADEFGATLSEVNRTVEDINLRTRAQVVRADAIVSDAIDATEGVSQAVQEGIRVPLRQVAGIVAGVKAGIETLVARFPFGTRD
jgi:methyl-accepting chemotaxis protein